MTERGAKSEESDLTKKRASYKGRLTVFETHLNSLDVHSIEESEISELQLRISKIDSLYALYDEVQTRIECITDDFEAQLSARSDFENRYFKLLSKAQQITASHHKSRSNPSSESGSSRFNAIKLPTIQLPRFSGSYENWLEFHDTFCSLIHTNDDIDEINKFHYLRASLEGSAKVIIQSIEFSAVNYKIAWQLLCDRFNNKRLLIQNHVSALFNIEPIAKESSASIKRVIDQVNKNIRTLECLGEPTKHWDTLLIYIVTKKLDTKTLREWEERKGNFTKDEPITLQSFLNFMQNRADFIETLELSNNSTNTHTSLQKNTKLKSMVSVPSVNSSDNKSSFNPKSCPKCNEDHKLYNCPQFLALSNDARLRLLPNLKICFNCFNGGHYANHCKKPGCKICKRKHHTLVHVIDSNSKPVLQRERTERAPLPPSPAQTNSESNINLTLSANVTLAAHRQDEVLLSTALIKLYDLNCHEYIARALLDSGSTSCIMTESMYRKLNHPCSHIDKSILGINNVSSRITKRCRVPMKSLDESFSANLQCFVLPSITDKVPCHPVDLSYLNIPTNVCLADPNFHTPNSIDLIIGSDVFWDLLLLQRIKLGDGKPMLFETKLGWIVSGPLNSGSASLSSYPIMCNFINLTSASMNCNEDIQKQLTRFWQLEEVENKSDYSPEQKSCKNHFLNSTTRLKNGRFCVRIPLKQNPDVLGNSFQKAKQYFLSLERRLGKQPLLYKMYKEFMSEYVSLGHMTECEFNENAHYIPHHGVLRENSTTTKLRVVFHASFPTLSGVSFNNIQMVGPTVQDDLLSILLRFRQHKFVIAADVEKMYRQVTVHADDRYLQQIIWRETPDKPLRVFQLNTVTYGTASAPFLATMCLNQLSLECDDPKVKEIVAHDFYVDDLLTGGDDYSEVNDLRCKITSVLDSACMPLRKWKSNCADLMSDSINSSIDLNVGGNEPSKTLGLGWQTKDDCLCFSIGTTILSGTTKREMLSVISQVFDPLGLLAPVIISMKIMMQRLWLHKLSWDEALSQDIVEEWVSITQCLRVLNNIRVPRRVIIDSSRRVELHIFTDASERAYGACLYVRSISENGDIWVRLLVAKSRVAPLKPTTIPRLELCGALCGARLYKKVITALRVKVTRTVLWTDSTIVLGWLRMLPRKLQTFVRNRVGEIHELTGNCVWRHVPTAENPADYVSRGVNAESMQSLSMWWSGPSFLKTEDESTWPTNPSSLVTLPETETSSETSSELTCLFQVNKADNINYELINFNRFSNFKRLIRAVAYMLRFIEVCRKRPLTTNYLSENELSNALNVVIRVSQKESFPEYSELLKGKALPNKSSLLKFNAFIDKNKLMRVGGRLENSSYTYNKKHPILIQSTHRFTKLLFEFEHTKLMHAGPQLLLAIIKDNYWPIGGRSLAKVCYRLCLRCSRMKAKTTAPLMGNLPQQRIEPGGYPFENVGVDYAGPISSVNRKGRGCRIVKVYIAIFICFTTKAIHLELVGDLCSNTFLSALRRFVSRRGKPANLYSDNGTTFVGAYNDLSKFLKANCDSLSSDAASDGINFHFIPAYSPHFGGIWEAGVKSTKFHLQRVLGNCNLTYEELNTTLVQIEGILNSRPLTPLSSHPEDLMPLTPGHFLIGRPLVSLPARDHQNQSTNHLTRFQRIEQLRQHFWTRWSKEYVSELQQRTKWRSGDSNLKINSLVLLKEDNLPPLKWRLGRIVALYPGLDLISRVADIKTSTGIIRRSFSKICVLPEPNSSG